MQSNYTIAQYSNNNNKKRTEKKKLQQKLSQTAKGTSGLVVGYKEVLA